MPRVFAAGALFPFDTHLRDRQGVWVNDVGVDVATIREFGAKFGRGVAVEPGVTNLYTQTQFETQFGGYNVTNGHRPADVTNQPDEWRRVPKVDSLTGVTNTEIFVDVVHAVTAEQRYTVHWTFRVDGTLPTFGTLVFFLAPSGHTSTPVTVRSLGGGVYALLGSIVMPAGTTAARASLFVSSWGTSTYIDVQEPMYFRHLGVHAGVTAPIHTSHVWGTRAGGVLKYPGPLLPRAQGTISCWIRPNYDFAAFPAADYRGIVTSTITHLSDQMLFWITGAPPAALNFVVFAGGGATQVDISYVPSDWSPARPHHVAVTWSDVEQVLYYDGVRVSTRTGSFTRWPEASWVTVGTASTPSSPNDWLDGLLDDLAILPRQLTDADIAAIFASALPFLGESGLAAAAQRSEIIHLLEMEFSGGPVRFTSGPTNIILDPKQPHARAVTIGATTDRYFTRDPVGTWPTTELTVEYWGRLDAAALVSLDKFGFSYNVAGSSLGELWLGLVTTGTQWRIALTVRETLLFDNTAYPTDGAWHHLAATWRSSDGQTLLYIDGALAHSGTKATGLSIGPAGTLVLGQIQPANALNAWQGELDDVRVYSRVLSPTEVAEHYAGVFLNEAGLVGAWGFDDPESLGTDLSPAGNHLTPVGITVGNPDTRGASLWSAAGSAMTFEAVAETPDLSGQRLKLTLDGVSLGAIAALLGEGYIGRLARLYRAHLGADGRIVADPILLFLGYMNAPWLVSEDWDQGWAKVETEIVSPLAVFSQIQGITADLNSHQAHFPGDTFFGHITTKPEGDFGWGILEKVPSKRLG